MIRFAYLTIAAASLILLGAEPGRTQPEKPKPGKAKNVRPGLATLLKSSPLEFIRRFDKNKDGSLSKDELPPRLANAFNKVDADGNGRLDTQEVERLLTVLRRRFSVDGESKPSAGDSKKNEAADRVVGRILEAMDKNKDGKISRAEAEGRVAGAFDRLDGNGDGYLDQRELRNMAARVLAQQGGGNGPRPAGRRPAPDFDSFDQNADGRLTREELKGTSFFRVFDDLDANKDGKVTPKEFAAYLKKQTEKDGPPAGKQP